MEAILERIKRLTPQQRSYDRYIESGSGDVCFLYGMSGRCGPECPEFGMRDGCREEAAEHCLTTNCLGCEIGSYPDCHLADLKEQYMNPEGD